MSLEWMPVSDPNGLFWDKGKGKDQDKEEYKYKYKEEEKYNRNTQFSKNRISFQVVSLEWMAGSDPNGLFSATSDKQKIDQKLHKPVPTSHLKLPFFQNDLEL